MRRNCNVAGIFTAALLFLLSACNVTKNIPDNDALYTGAKVTITDKSQDTKIKKVLEEDLQKLTRPKPNSKLLGIPFKLAIHNMFGPSKGKGLMEIVRKLGEPPVLLSEVSIDANVRILRNYLENRGFFHAAVSGDTT